MRRRDFLASIVSLVGGCDQNTSTSRGLDMPTSAPEKIRLIPDNWRIQYVGRLADRRLFWVDAQLDPAGGATKDFVCTFVFDEDGHSIDHSIELIGVRGSYPSGKVANAIDQHLAALGDRTITDIWVRLFSVASNNTVFGLIPRQTEGGGWRVEF